MKIHTIALSLSLVLSTAHAPGAIAQSTPQPTSIAEQEAQAIGVDAYPYLEAPTPYFWTIGRTQTDGPSEYAMDTCTPVDDNDHRASFCLTSGKTMLLEQRRQWT